MRKDYGAPPASFYGIGLLLIALCILASFQFRPEKRIIANAEELTMAKYLYEKHNIVVSANVFEPSLLNRIFSHVIFINAPYQPKRLKERIPEEGIWVSGMATFIFTNNPDYVLSRL